MPVIEFRAGFLHYLPYALWYGLVGGLATWAFYEWLGVTDGLPWAVGAFLIGWLGGALLASLTRPGLQVVRVGPDWVFGPGSSSGVQVTVHRDQISALRMSRGRLIIENRANDDIVIRLAYYGAHSDDLLRRVEAMSGLRTP